MTVTSIHSRRSALQDSLSALVRLYVAHLEAEGIDEPLSQPFTLSAVLADLFALAGIPIPADVAALIGEESRAPVD